MLIQRQKWFLKHPLSWAVWGMFYYSVKWTAEMKSTKLNEHWKYKHWRKQSTSHVFYANRSWAKSFKSSSQVSILDGVQQVSDGSMAELWWWSDCGLGLNITNNLWISILIWYMSQDGPLCSVLLQSKLLISVSKTAMFHSIFVNVTMDGKKMHH